MDIIRLREKDPLHQYNNIPYTLKCKNWVIIHKIYYSLRDRIMKKRKVIITGANSGIGKAAAFKFASESYHVIMACRSRQKGETAMKEIIDSVEDSSLELMQVDVSSFESIRSFCDEYRSNYNSLDILIHNAAYFNHGEKLYQMSPDGIEITFATNTFGPFLMTELLKDLLAKSDDPRILVACTTNIKHFFDPKRTIEFDNLQGEHKDSRLYNVYKLYGDSKIALLMLTFRWAEEFKADGIKVNAVMINNIRQEWQSLKKFKGWYRFAGMLQNLFAYSSEMMAELYFDICTSDKFRDVTGKLINHRLEIVECSDLTDESGFLQVAREIKNGKTYPKYADNIEIRRKVWEMNINLTGLNEELINKPGLQ